MTSTEHVDVLVDNKPAPYRKHKVGTNWLSLCRPLQPEPPAEELESANRLLLRSSRRPASVFTGGQAGIEMGSHSDAAGLFSWHQVRQTATCLGHARFPLI